MNQPSTLKISAAGLTVALVLLAIGLAAHFLNNKWIGDEIQAWSRGYNKDVCLPLPVACGKLEKGHQAAQCNLVKQTVKEENIRVKAQLKSMFPKLKIPAKIFHFTSKPAKNQKTIFVHQPTVKMMADGGRCNTDVTVDGNLGETIREPLFGNPTKRFHVHVCFNKYRAAKGLHNFSSKNHRKNVEFMNRYGPGLAIAHELHHPWMGQHPKTNKIHPSASCALMCKSPKHPDLSDTALTLMKKVIENCRGTAPDT